MKNLQINNFDLIFNKEKRDSQKIEQYRTIDHKEIMGYPEKEREQIMSSVFRNVKWKDMFIQNETLHGHFKVNSKSVGWGRFIKKIQNGHYKETWWSNICHLSMCIFNRFFSLLSFNYVVI